MALETLFSIRQHLSQDPLPPSAKSRASIAAIFRIIPTNDPVFPVSQSALQYFQREILLNPSLLAGKLQLFFIKRAENPRDLHSAQVAFPGGKKELDETSIDTAIRETFEEVGIDLTGKEFIYLGRNEEMNPYWLRGRKALMLCTHGTF